MRNVFWIVFFCSNFLVVHAVKEGEHGGDVSRPGTALSSPFVSRPRPTLPALEKPAALQTDFFHLGYRPSAIPSTPISTSPGSLSRPRGKRLDRLKLDGLSRPSTPSSVESMAATPVSLVSSESAEEAMSSGSRRLKKHSSDSSVKTSLSSTQKRKHRQKLTKLHSLPSLKLSGAAKLKKEGVVIGVQPVCLDEYLGYGVRPGHTFALSGHATVGGEIYYVFDLQSQSFEDFKRMWLDMRHRIVALRNKLYAFRAFYTKKVRDELDEAGFIAACNSCACMTSEDLFEVPENVYGSLHDINVIYHEAHRQYETALAQAEKVFMGSRHLLPLDFPPYYALPEGSAPIPLMNRPLCIECSRRKEGRVFHACFDEKAPEFEDECPTCATSSLRDMYEDQKVLDPATHYSAIVAPQILGNAFYRLDEALFASEYYMNCLLLGEDRALSVNHGVQPTDNVLESAVTNDASVGVV